MKPLRIATDTSAQPHGAETQWLLAPLLDPSLATDPSERLYRRIYRHYYRAAADLFTLTPLEEADVALVPADWSTYQGSFSWLARSDRAAIGRAREFAERARLLGKPVAVFFTGERSHERVPLPGAWVFRKSMYRSRRGPRDVMVPEVFYLDLLEQLGMETIDERPWVAKPSVGFCGMARRRQASEHLSQLAFFLVHLAREGASGVSPYIGVELRLRAIEVVRASNLVSSKFIVRDKSVFYGSENKTNRERVRREFLDNIRGADYQLALRGSANYSYRPWEAMCVGRPPLFVDTDCVWPFDNEVDWSKLVVQVDESDLARLPEALLDAHSALDDTRFRELQHACRTTWERYLTPLGLARWLRDFLAERVAR